MTRSRQQEESLAYFRQAARQWRETKTRDSAEKFNVPRARNEFVLKVAELTGAARTLDAGCGSGELVLALAEQGRTAVGLDFSPEMIDLARDQARARGLDQARFVCASVLDYQFEGPLDLVSANGLIEYFSGEELVRFVDRMVEALGPGGSLVVGSRNRLLNLFSLNEYTVQEMTAGHLESLLREAVVIAEAEDQAGLIEALGRIEAAPHQRSSVPSDRVEGDVQVANRLQYTPAQLVQFLAGRGFEVVTIEPVNVHAAVPRFKRAFPRCHTELAYLLSDYTSRTTTLLPFGSTFMVWARRPGA